MKKTPVKPLVPNILTLSNLLLGMLSLIYTLNGNYKAAAFTILLSTVLDRMDGKVARAWRVSSEFGKELDSLADLVSFGVAPAILVFVASLQQPMGVAGFMVAVTFAVCGAIRLARFNILNISDYFLGMPITIAGGLMAITVLFAGYLATWMIVGITLLLAALMVSPFRLPKF